MQVALSRLPITRYFPPRRDIALSAITISTVSFDFLKLPRVARTLWHHQIKMAAQASVSCDRVSLSRWWTKSLVGWKNLQSKHYHQYHKGISGNFSLWFHRHFNKVNFNIWFHQNASSAGVATTRVVQTQPRQVSSSLASGTATSITLGATTSLTPASSAAVVSQVRGFMPSSGCLRLPRTPETEYC